MLREQTPRGALAEGLADVDRLILLGDVIELRHGPPKAALQAALPALAQIADALGPEKEVVIVPGNHDHQLLRPWLERRSTADVQASLGLEAGVDFREGEILHVLAGALKPAAVRAAYPGVWLREDVYATHGHYSDRHTTVPLLERLGAGVLTRVVPEPPGGPGNVEDYEATLGPLYALLAAVVAHRRPRFYSGGRDTFQVKAWRGLASRNGRRTSRAGALKASFAVGVAALNRAGLGPLKADVSGRALRVGGLRGMAEVVERLNIAAPNVIFGHTHRAGPLAGDDPTEWRAPAGQALHNCGSWLLEPAFLGERPERSPYRPGFGVLIEADGPPQLRNLLDATPIQA